MTRIVGCACVLVVAVLAIVLLGGAAVIAALLPALPSQPASTQVGTGRPCADPVETQGYMPGPGAFEPDHTGIDFVCEGNPTLVAVLPGTVVIADNGPCPNTFLSGELTFGCSVDIETTVDGRTLYSRYGHMAQGSLDVTVGEEVTVGDPLGIEGESGFATGLHVHFEIDAAKPSTADALNPVPYLDPAIVHCPCHG